MKQQRKMLSQTLVLLSFSSMLVAGLSPPPNAAGAMLQDSEFQIEKGPSDTAHVDPNPEDANRIRDAVRIVNAPYEVSPWHEITLTERDKTLLVGLQTIVDVTAKSPLVKDPRVKAVKEACDYTKIGLESAIESVDYRGKLLEDDLLVISGYADRLKAMHEKGVNLKEDKDAQKMIGELEQRMRAPDEEWYEFAGKALYSPRGAYAVVKRVAFDKVFPKLLGDSVAERLGLGKRVQRLGKRGLGRLANRLAGVRWKTITRVSNESVDFSDNLLKLAIKKIAKDLTKEAITGELDKIFEEIMRERTKEQPFPSGTYNYGYDRNFASRLRVEMFVRPQAVLPALQPLLVAPRAVDIVVPRAEMPILIIPSRVEIHQDPVLNAASVQNQVYSANYSVESSQDTYKPEPVSGPMRGSNVREVDVQKHFQSTWTGGVGGSLYTRY